MADVKITALTAASSVLATDITVVVADPGGTPVTKKVTLANLSALILASPALTGTIGTPLTASRAIATDSSGNLAVATTTAAELAFVHGVTSAIQTQLNALAPLASPTFTGTVTGTFSGNITGNVTGNTSGTAATFTGSLTGPVTSSGMATTLIESYTGMIASAADGTYTIDLYAAYSGTINTLKIITDSGTTTAKIAINGTQVTGISAVSVSSTIATGTATAANTFSAGDKITLVLSSSSSPVNLAFTLKYTRT